MLDALTPFRFEFLDVGLSPCSRIPLVVAYPRTFLLLEIMSRGDEERTAMEVDTDLPRLARVPSLSVVTW